MERLTKKKFLTDYVLKDYSEKGKSDAINKLGCLEDVLERNNVEIKDLDRYLQIAAIAIVQHEVNLL